MIDFEWNAILARIEGLRLITDLAIAGQGRVSGGEGLGVPVRDEAAQIRAAIQRWRSDFDLPEPVRSALDDFELDYVERSQTPLSGNAAAAIANFAMPLLRIGPRVTFLLRNPQEAIRRRAELAFLH
ncbi:MAG TPA: hypothetical protein VG820_05295, partial [Fimbriimonadaceae bacterium]|nr:hypothetical protein [Fimbriimonadaceae bacterium]